MGIFDKIKDALGSNNQRETASSDAATTPDVPFDPTLDAPASDSAQATAPADSAAATDAPSTDPVVESTDRAAGADIGSILSGQSAEHSMEPAAPAAQPEPSPVIEQQPEAPAPQAPAAAEPTTYTVVEGDNLTWIGERYGVSVDDLVAANNIENPDLIFPGQVLTIPR